MRIVHSIWIAVSLSVTAQAAESVHAIRLVVARQQAELSERYLAEHPDADDRLEAVNLLLESYQALGDYQNLSKYLEQRYGLIKPARPAAIDSKQLDLLVIRTVLPLLELHYRLFRYDKAKAFMAEVEQDLAGHPVLQQLTPAMKQLEDRYRMPEVGDTPSVQFTDFLTGEDVRLTQFRGRYVLLEFWVTACDICKAQKGFLHEAQRMFAEEGFDILAFSQDPEEEVLRSYFENHDEPWYHCFDSDPAHRNAAALKVRVIPYNMMVDPEGKVVAVNLRENALLDFLHGVFPQVPRVD